MTSILAADAGLLASASLTRPDVKTLLLLARHGGDLAWSRTASPQASRDLVDSLVRRRLIVIVDENIIGRSRLRLTDFGRNAVAQIEAAAARGELDLAAPPSGGASPGRSPGLDAVFARHQN